MISGVPVMSEVECAGSYHVRCPRRLECMAELTPDRVWPFVLAVEWHPEDTAANDPAQQNLFNALVREAACAP